MNKEQFGKIYSAIFTERDQRYTYAFKKWLEYYYTTELYDRRVCSGFNENTQSAIPLGLEEHRDINRNAKLLHNNTLSDLRARNINEEVWRSAREMALRYSHNEIETLLVDLADKN